MCKNMDNLNIGGVPLKSHAVLAPMAGVSDRAYRELCVRFLASAMRAASRQKPLKYARIRETPWLIAPWAIAAVAAALAIAS